MREVISTKDAPSSPLYSQTVKAGQHVYVSGSVGFDTTGNLVGSTIQEQTRQAFTNCETILKAAGASWTTSSRSAFFRPIRPTSQA
jgi:2-iminobutanoate/2-iminopropanoate deaminase